MENEASQVRLHTRHNTQAGRWVAAREGSIVDEGAGKGAIHILRQRLLTGAPWLCSHPLRPGPFETYQIPCSSQRSSPRSDITLTMKVKPEALVWAMCTILFWPYPRKRTSCHGTAFRFAMIHGSYLRRANV